MGNLELKNRITEIKSSVGCLHRRMNGIVKRISELEPRVMEITSLNNRENVLNFKNDKKCKKLISEV